MILFLRQTVEVLMYVVGTPLYLLFEALFSIFEVKNFHGSSRASSVYSSTEPHDSLFLDSSTNFLVDRAFLLGEGFLIS